MLHTVAAAAALLLALGVGAGAFGAHALKDTFSPYQVAIWEKAVFYQLTHCLGALIVALMPGENAFGGAARLTVALLLLGGSCIFSGSLYLLALSGAKWWGAVTPIGGTLFIVAWLYLAWSLLRAE